MPDLEDLLQDDAARWRAAIDDEFTLHEERRNDRPVDTIETARAHWRRWSPVAAVAAVLLVAIGVTVVSNQPRHTPKSSVADVAPATLTKLKELAQQQTGGQRPGEYGAQAVLTTYASAQSYLDGTYTPGVDPTNTPGDTGVPDARTPVWLVQDLGSFPELANRCRPPQQVSAIYIASTFRSAATTFGPAPSEPLSVLGAVLPLMAADAPVNTGPSISPPVLCGVGDIGPPDTIDLTIGTHHFNFLSNRDPGPVILTVGQTVTISLKITAPDHGQISDIYFSLGTSTSPPGTGGPDGFFGQYVMLARHPGVLTTGSAVTAQWTATPLFGSNQISVNLLYSNGYAGIGTILTNIHLHA